VAAQEVIKIDAIGHTNIEGGESMEILEELQRLIERNKELELIHDEYVELLKLIDKGREHIKKEETTSGKRKYIRKEQNSGNHTE
jgi:hypothetical protein